MTPASFKVGEGDFKHDMSCPMLSQDEQQLCYFNARAIVFIFESNIRFFVLGLTKTWVKMVKSLFAIK